MSVTTGLRTGWLLPLLLVLLIARLWLMPLGSSLWLDEMATVFVVRHGTQDPSLAVVAPQAWRSVYYFLPRAMEEVFGFSEVVYRLPSVVAMAVALFLVARLAARLIDRRAGWFAVFACLALKGINYEAADARPYALGMCVAATSLHFLVRWLDGARWSDAVAFVLSAALVWRVHLLFWPFYIVMAAYAAARIVPRETAVGWGVATAVAAVLAASLVPVAKDALQCLTPP